MTKQDKVAKVMHEWKNGRLFSNGKKVTDYDQAIAIALSEAGLSKYAGGGELSERKRYSVGELKGLGYAQIKGDKNYRYYFKKGNNKYEFKVIPSVGINSGFVNEDKTMLALISKYAEGGEVEHKIQLYNLQSGDKIFDPKDKKNKIVESLDKFKEYTNIWFTDGSMTRLNFNSQIVLLSNKDFDAEERRLKNFENKFKFAEGGGVGFLSDSQIDKLNKLEVFTYLTKIDPLGNFNVTRGTTKSLREVAKRITHNKKSFSEGGGIDEIEVPLRADIDGDIYEVIGVNHKLNKVKAKDFSSGDVIEMPIDKWIIESFVLGTQAKFKANGREYVGMVVMKNGQKSISLYKDENYSGDAERVIPFREINIETLKPTMEKEKFSKGGNVIERRYVNKDEDYETRYAKDKPMRKGYNDERMFAEGGETGKFAYGSTSMLKVELENNLRTQQGMNKMMLENDMPKSYVADSMRLQARAEDLVKELKHRGVNINSILYKEYDKFAVGGGVGSLLEQRKELLEELINSDIIDEEHGYYDDVKDAIKSNDSEQMREIIDELLSSGLIYKDDWDYKLARKLSKENNKFAVGGEIGNTVSFKGDYGTPRSGVVKEKRGSSYIVATDDGDRLVDSYEVISFSETPIAKKKRFGFFAEGGSIESKKQAILDFINSFPDKPKDWSEATDDLPELHHDIADEYGNKYDFDFNKRSSLRDINLRHKQHAKSLLNKLSDEEIDKIYSKWEETLEDKFEGGGEIQSKIDKLQAVVNSKMLPEGVKEKARKQIAELEKELKDSKESVFELERKYFDTKISKGKEYPVSIWEDQFGTEYITGKKYSQNERAVKTENTLLSGFNQLTESEKQLLKSKHESKETKAEEKEEHKKGGSEYKSKLEKDLEKELHRLQRDLFSDRLLKFREGDDSEEAKEREKERQSKLNRFTEIIELLNKGYESPNKEENPIYQELYAKAKEENKMTGESEGERNVGMDKPEDYIEAKVKNLEASLKDKTISEAQRKRDEKELALFKGAEAKKPTTIKFGNITFTIDSAELENGGNVYGGHIDIYNRVIKGFPYNYKTAKEVEERMKSYIKEIKSVTYNGSKGRESQKFPYLVIFNDGQAEIKEKFETAKEALNFHKVLDRIVNNNTDKKPTTRKAPIKKAVAKKVVEGLKPKFKVGDVVLVNYGEERGVIGAIETVSYYEKYPKSMKPTDIPHYEIKGASKDISESNLELYKAPKADHKKLVAKLKAKKGQGNNDRGDLINYKDGSTERRKRSESSDKKRTALPLGKRVSADGNVYYERRLNRADISKEDKFKRGGFIYEVQKKGSPSNDMKETMFTAKNLTELKKKIIEKYGTSKDFLVRRRTEQGYYVTVKFEDGGEVKGSGWGLNLNW